LFTEPASQRELSPMYFDTLNKKQMEEYSSCLLQMVVKNDGLPNFTTTSTRSSVNGINSKDIAHGLLLSCACELNPMTIITATKSLLRCFILKILITI
jgi:hypothetical protein